MASLKRQNWSTSSHIILIIWSLVVLFPIFMMLLSSFHEKWNFINYVEVLRDSNFLIYFRNSFMVVIISLALLLITGSLAAYALANWRNRFTRGIYFFFIAGMMLPIKIASIRILELIRFLGLENTVWSLIPVYIAMGLPISVLILSAFIRQIPYELTEAGIIDGAGPFRIYLNIILPLLKPALATTAIYNLVPFWNDFWFPLIFISDDRAKTLLLGITRLFSLAENDWSKLLAAIILSAIPVILLYLLMSRQFIKGLTAGAVKG